MATRRRWRSTPYDHAMNAFRFVGRARRTRAVVLGATLLVGVTVGCSSGKASTETTRTTIARTATTATASATTARGGSTTPASSTTLAAGTAGSVPVTTGAAAKPYAAFCKEVESVQQQLGALDPASTTPEQRLAAAQRAFAQVTADAPPSIKADLQTIDDFVKKAASLEALAGSIPPDLGPALQRVMQWFSTNCGVDLQLG